MKNTTIIALLVLIPHLVGAQEGLHLTMGGNSSRLQSETSQFSSKYGYQVGIQYTDIYSKGVDFSTGIRYITRGGKLSMENLNLGYLDATIALGFRPVNSLRLFAGAHISALLQSPSFITASGLDLGLQVGVRYDLDKMFFGATYQHGLAKISGFNDSASTRGLELGVGFMLDLRPAPEVPTESVIIRPSVIDPAETVMQPEEQQAVEGDALLAYSREVAVRVAGLERFELIYKERIRATRYNRLSLLGLAGDFVPEEDAINFAIGVTFGPEYRRSLDAATYMAHGPQLEMTVGYSREDFRNILLLRPGLGYLIGIHHTLSDRFSIGLEIVPVLRYEYIEDTNSGEGQSRVTLDLSTQSAAIVASYSFGIK